MKRKYIKFELPEDEFNDFERYLLATGQTKTEVLRQLLKTLSTDWRVRANDVLNIINL